jgi:hypothetical protein
LCHCTSRILPKLLTWAAEWESRNYCCWHCDYVLFWGVVQPRVVWWREQCRTQMEPKLRANGAYVDWRSRQSKPCINWAYVGWRDEWPKCQVNWTHVDWRRTHGQFVKKNGKEGIKATLTVVNYTPGSNFNVCSMTRRWPRQCWLNCFRE